MYQREEISRSMTTAVCFRCGAFKHGALNECETCGTPPISTVEQAISLSLTDHHYSAEELKRLGGKIVSGKLERSVDTGLVTGYLESLRSDHGRDMARLMDGTLSQNENPESRDKSQTCLIAKRLLAIAEQFPGRVRLVANPGMERKVSKVFVEMGARRKLFQSASNHIYRATLTYGFAILRILPSSLLISNYGHPEMGVFNCWSGSGRFRGRKTVAQLREFNKEPMMKVAMIIFLAFIFDEIEELLEPPP